MKRISLNNGHSYMTAQEAMPEITDNNLWDTVVNMMDDDTREDVHADLAPCSDEAFLTEYLRRAKEDLIIG
jgi:hypothetical protein